MDHRTDREQFVSLGRRMRMPGVPQSPHGRAARVLSALLLGGTLAAAAFGGASGAAHAAPARHAGNAPMRVASTKPANGDQNPYGVAVVPRTMGALVKGDVLVSNFNNGKNLAGLGTTIVEIAPNGAQRLFAQIDARQLPGSCPGGVGLTTALTVLQRGYVIVGSLPTTDGTPATAQPGCLLVLNTRGQVISTITAPDIDGPWDMAAVDQGSAATLFISNALNGIGMGGAKSANEGTVVRLTLQVPSHGRPQVLSNTIIASGFAEMTDPAALVIGPTGLGLDQNGTLYVADTLENRIAAIPDALTRMDSAYTGYDLTAGGALNGPLGLAIAPNGDILTVNGNDGNLVETDVAGTQVLTSTISMAGSPPGAGALFGLAEAPDGDIFFADDNALTLNRWAGSGVTDRAVASLLPENGSSVTGAAFLLRHGGKVEVLLQVSGLAPNSIHPAHIHQGTSCTAGGPVIYPFPNLQANAQGEASLDVMINTNSIPATGWYINIHQGPGMDTPLACGVVQQPM